MNLTRSTASRIDAVVATLQRRHDSTTDSAERKALGALLRKLEKRADGLDSADALDALKALSATSDDLERAVGAARRGPFNGHLTALEKHLGEIDDLTARRHSSSALGSAIVGRASSTRPMAARATRSATAASATRSAPPRVTGSAPPRATRSAPSVARDIGGIAAPINSKDFAVLRDEYQSYFDACTVRPEKKGDLAFCRKMLLKGKPSYVAIQDSLGIPWQFVGVIHGMEASFNFSRHLHNGDALTARTVQVPKGRPKLGDPPFTWQASAIDALTMKKLQANTDWSVPRMLFILEGYNGFGYRSRAVRSPYLWSFSNLYEKGKFVADGSFNPDAVSKQCGAALMLKEIH